MKGTEGMTSLQVLSFPKKRNLQVFSLFLRKRQCGSRLDSMQTAERDLRPAAPEYLTDRFTRRLCSGNADLLADEFSSGRGTGNINSTSSTHPSQPSRSHAFACRHRVPEAAHEATPAMRSCRRGRRDRARAR